MRMMHIRTNKKKKKTCNTATDKSYKHTHTALQPTLRRSRKRRHLTLLRANALITRTHTNTPHIRSIRTIGQTPWPHTATLSGQHILTSPVTLIVSVIVSISSGTAESMLPQTPPRYSTPLLHYARPGGAATATGWDTLTVIISGNLYVQEFGLQQATIADGPP